jgi:surfeit locus 1 family protein
MSDVKVAKPRRFPIGLTIATAVACAILCGLGTWQVQRMAWKQDLLARIAQRGAMAPIAVAQIPPDAEFTRVTVRCPGLATADFVEQYALRDGGAGQRLLSLCRLGGPADLLVDRGFVADTVSARPAVAASADPVTVTGVLRSGDAAGRFTPPTEGRRFFHRDPSAMARALGSTRPVYSYVLVAETATNPDWKGLAPAPLPAEISNRHLEYALTWFGLAVTLLVIYAAMLRRRS